MKLSLINKAIVGMIGVSVIGGCATTEQANKEIVKNSGVAQTKFDASYNKVPSDSFFKKEGNIWVNPEPIPSSGNKKTVLPPVFKKEVVAVFPGTVVLSEVLSDLARNYGINFDVAQDVYEPLGGLGTVIDSSSKDGEIAMPAPTNLAQTMIGVNPGSLITVYCFVGSDTRERSLDVLATKTNLSWKWNQEKGKVDLYRYESKNYYISALGGSIALKSSIKSGSTATGSGSSANQVTTGQSTDVQSQITIWSDIKSYLRSMLSPRGRMSIMESSGIVTVRDTPSVQAKVEDAVKELNALLSKQVMVNIDVYSVNISDADKYGVDWDAVWSLAGKSFNLAYNTAGYTSGNIFSAGVVSGPFTNTKALISAVSSLTNTSLVTNASLITLNGQPAPFMVGKETGYIKSVTTTVSTDGVSQTSAEQGVLNSGFSLSLLPKIQRDGGILMQYSIDLSSIDELKEIIVGTNTIQVPTRSMRNILQMVNIKSGETLILSGFQQTEASVSNSGVGSSSNMLFGGSKGANNNKNQLIIMITPFIAK